jgi:hypothetical protein
MALKQLIDAALAHAASFFGGDLHTAFGRSEARRHGCHPQLVVYPVSGSASPAKNNGKNQTQMWTREVSCVAEIWAKDYDDAERMMDNLGEALDLESVTSWRMEGEDWDEGGDAEAGVRVNMRFRVFVPLTRRGRKTVTVAEWQMAGALKESV